VDDDADTVEFIGSLLRPDYEFIGTIDSTSAPDKIIAYQPDVLLLDINMPHLNGFHLSHLIRLNKRLKGAKVIFVSSRSDRESVEQAFRLGACEFIEKPFTPDQLRRKILEVIQRPDFQRNKKRVDYRELQRREGEIT
jgi:two-component system response regulator protein BraR/BceR